MSRRPIKRSAQVAAKGFGRVQADELIDLIYQGPLEPTPWQSFLRALRLRMNCDAAAMSLRIQRDEMIAVNVWDHRKPELDTDALRRATQNLKAYGHLDPLAKALVKPGDLFTIDEVMPRKQLLQTDYYKFVLAPFDVEYQMGMHIAEPGGWRSNVGLMNGRQAGNFGPAHKAFLASLRPHLERALQLHARITKKTLESAAFEKALDRLTIAVYVIDADGRLIDLNSVGRKMAERRDGLLITSDRLVLSRAKDNARLATAITRALSAREAGQADEFSDLVRITRKDGAYLSLLVRAISASDDTRNYASPSVIVYACDQSLSKTAPDRLIAEMFGFSPAEARIASLLAGGMTLAEIAKTMGIRESTVRTYAKRTFGKAGVSRQSELVRMILNSVAPL
jgi:DNA-binding CsgD family transcriptional regulator/PAS domain-containing protein